MTTTFSMFCFRSSLVVSKRRRLQPLVFPPFYHFGSISARFSTTRPENDFLAQVESLPIQYLRSLDPSRYDPVTGQRIDIEIDSHSGKLVFDRKSKCNEKVAIERYHLEGNNIRVVWHDGQQSIFPRQLLMESVKYWKQQTLDQDPIYWKGFDEGTIRSSSSLCLSFKDVIATSECQSIALKALYKYGILLVTDTPVDDGGVGVAALSASLGGGSKKNSTSLLSYYKQGASEIMIPTGTDGPLRTMYGTVWSTVADAQADGASVADSAYGHDALPLHTDLTYYRDPPGLQIFTMKTKAAKGGESVFCDGFEAANHLQTINPEAFSLLSTTIRRYRSIDRSNGWHLQANGPVIGMGNGRINMIRHNDLDRLPDLPPSRDADFDLFYDALSSADDTWNKILSEDARRLMITLAEGDTIVVANQRCLHGRKSFSNCNQSPRSVIGCYVGQDELNSRFRMEGFRF